MFIMQSNEQLLFFHINPRLKNDSDIIVLFIFRLIILLSGIVFPISESEDKSIIFLLEHEMILDACKE